MKEFQSKNIAFTFIKLDSVCDKMIAEMQKNHTAMQVTDLEQATKNKTSAEVSKMFIDSASFILRAAVGGKAGKGDAGRSGKSSGESLWDLKQL